MRNLFLLPFAIALMGADAGNAPIVAAISGIPNAKGVVQVDICTEDVFTKTRCRWRGEAVAVPGTTVVTIANVPPGRYAALAYHDANGNGKTDRNFIGMPTELLGFSNDVRVKMAPPKFAAAAFNHGREANRISFAIRRVP